MYEAPHLYGAENCLLNVSTNVINCLVEECNFFNCCDEDIANMCRNLMEDYNYQRADTPYDAARLYMNLRTTIYEIVQTLD